MMRVRNSRKEVLKGGSAITKVAKEWMRVCKRKDYSRNT